MVRGFGGQGHDRGTRHTSVKTSRLLFASAELAFARDVGGQPRWWSDRSGNIFFAKRVSGGVVVVVHEILATFCPSRGLAFLGSDSAEAIA